MATLIAHKLIQSTNGNAATSASADISGATLIVAFSNTAFADVTPSDGVNTFTGLTLVNWTGGLAFTRIYYCLNPTTSTTYQLTLGGTGRYPCGGYLAWDTYNAFDVESAQSVPAGPDQFQNGAVTPSVNDSLIVTFLGQGGAATGTPTIDLSFTVDEFGNSNGNSQPSCFGHLELGTASSKNPMWTRTATGASAMCNAVFKTVAAGTLKLNRGFPMTEAVRRSNIW